MCRSDVIDNSGIAPGNVIVGLSSFGQASYESRYNGGMGSNGLTSARHDVLAHYIAEKYPESYDTEIPAGLAYTGSCRLTDKVDGLDVTVGELILSPTRTYAPIIREIIRNCRKAIRGMVHCSGGGQTKVLHFIDGGNVVKDNLFDTPPLFDLIRRQSGTPWREMYEVFNMGHRMELYVEPEAAAELIAISQSYNVDAKITGHVEPSEKPQVTILQHSEEHIYIKSS